MYDILKKTKISDNNVITNNKTVQDQLIKNKHIVKRENVKEISFKKPVDQNKKLIPKTISEKPVIRINLSKDKPSDIPEKTNKSNKPTTQV